MLSAAVILLTFINNATTIITIQHYEFLEKSSWFNCISLSLLWYDGTEQVHFWWWILNCHINSWCLQSSSTIITTTTTTMTQDFPLFCCPIAEVSVIQTSSSNVQPKTKLWQLKQSTELHRLLYCKTDHTMFITG